MTHVTREKQIFTRARALFIVSFVKIETHLSSWNKESWTSLTGLGPLRLARNIRRKVRLRIPRRKEQHLSSGRTNETFCHERESENWITHAYPDIYLGSCVFLSFEYFRCGVRWRSAPRRELTSHFEIIWETEVGYFYVIVRVEKKIFCLE